MTRFHATTIRSFALAFSAGFLLLTACDSGDPASPLALPMLPEGSLEVTSEAVWFTSTPPDPAYFVHTGNPGYDASADALFDNDNDEKGYLTIWFYDNHVDPHTDACAVANQGGPTFDHEEEEAQVIVFFLNPGTCIITAKVISGEHMGAEATQTFEIIEPLTPVPTPDEARIPAPRGNRPQ
jgi:hypothetical protein